MALKLTKEEMDWQAESDARTLAEAAAIKKDKQRLKKAVTKAKTMVNQETVRLSSLRQVSRTRINPRSKK